MSLFAKELIKHFDKLLFFLYSLILVANI